MKHLVIVMLLGAVALLQSTAAPRPARVPPPGIEISEEQRAELREGADALAREIASLRADGQTQWLADVEIFHKAVDWPLRYDEFYRSNEVGLARGLLKQGMERAQQLREGKPAWLNATGLVVRGYVSKIDGSVQPYGLVVPAGFSEDQSTARRLDVWLHGRDNNLTELKFISDRQRSHGDFAPPGAIVLHPYGRYCNAFKFAGEADVFEAMEHVKNSYRIDDSRIALRGFSMGGAGVWHLAAHYPHLWAVATPGAGFAETAEYQKLGTNRARFPWWEQKLWQWYDATDYAVNFANLPVISYSGDQDPQRQSGDVMERAMKAEGLVLPRVWGTNIGHKYTAESKREIEAFVTEALGQARGPLPSKVHFTTRTLRYSRTLGVEVLAMEKHWERADAVVHRSNSGLKILTTNVAELSVAGTTEQLRALEIDGIRVNVTVDSEQNPARATLVKNTEGRWMDALKLAARSPWLVKRPGLQGPIDDAFMDSFLIVRPTGSSANSAVSAWTEVQLAKATNEWRGQFRGDARVAVDSQVTDADIAAHNLVLFGDPESNRLLKRILNKLPIQWTTRELIVGKNRFNAANHAPVLICPNPLNPRRYVVVNSGFTFAAAGSGSNAQQTPKLPDYAVMNIESGVAVLADFFSEEWRVK